MPGHAGPFVKLGRLTTWHIPDEDGRSRCFHRIDLSPGQPGYKLREDWPFNRYGEVKVCWACIETYRNAQRQEEAEERTDNEYEGRAEGGPAYLPRPVCPSFNCGARLQWSAPRRCFVCPSCYKRYRQDDATGALYGKDDARWRMEEVIRPAEPLLAKPGGNW